jgi:hypothetical protein
MAAATKPNYPATVNPAAANNTVVASGSASKHSCFEHGIPANATKNNTTEPSPPASLAMHSATAKGANVPPAGTWQRPLAAVIASNMVTLPYHPHRCCRGLGPRRHCRCLSTCWTATLMPATQWLTIKLQGLLTMPPILRAKWKQPWTPP